MEHGESENSSAEQPIAEEKEPSLSEEQVHLINKISLGLTDEQIVATEHLSFGTYRKILSGPEGVFETLGVNTRAAAVEKGIEKGYVDIDAASEGFNFSLFDSLTNAELRIFEAATSPENLEKKYFVLGNELNLSEQRVKNTLSDVYKKLQITDLVQAVVYRTALEIGLDKVDNQK
jgi:DNA-binding NarL/FixJ family response regulator